MEERQMVLGQDRGPTFTEVAAEFRDNLKRDHKTLCPCCGTVRRINRHSISGTLARNLLWMYRHAYRYPADRYVSWREGMEQHGLATNFAILAYWGLIESTGEGHPRYPSKGHWRLTAEGIDFALGRTKVPKYCFDYYGKRWREGDDVSIWDCLPEEFDYYQLLGRAKATEAEAVVLDSIRTAADEGRHP